MSSKMVRKMFLAAYFALQLSSALAFPEAQAPVNSTAVRPAGNSTAPKAAAGNKPAGNATSTADAKKASQSAAMAAARKRKAMESAATWQVVHGFLGAWLVLVVTFFLYLTLVAIRRYLRTLSSLGSENNQTYFSKVNWYWGMVKKHFIFAPLIHKRHHRPFMLTRTIDNGSLPSRPQMLILVSYFVCLIAGIFVGIDYKQSTENLVTALERRTGTLTLANMLPLFLMATRHNPLILMTGISFDTYNLFHRWLGRFCFLTLIPHMTAFFYKRIPAQGWKSYKKSMEVNVLVRNGSIAFLCIFIMVLQSPAPIRHRFYEVFLHLHQALAAVLVYAVWWHMDGYSSQRKLVKGIIAIWATDRALRLVRLIYRNVGKPMTKAEIEIMSPIAMRVKVRVARGWTFYPGQHAYMYMPFVGLWTSHPFSVAWTDDDVDEDISEKDMKLRVFDENTRKKNIYFLIRRMKGFTNHLYTKAEKAGGRITTTALIEGPYNYQSLRSYGTVILVAAGIGITHIVPHVHDLVRGYSEGSVATRRVTMIWSVRTLEELELIRDWMAIILALPRRQEVLRVILYVFQLDDGEFHSPSKSIQVYPGIAKFGPIIDEEVLNSIGSVGVSVCGIGVVADEVRYACRQWMDKVNIEFMEESFSW